MDIGVNIGQTLIKLKSVDKNIVYYGFEPNSICVQYVKELIKVNGFTNTNLFPVGVSDQDQFYQLAFFSQGETDPSASIVENFRPDQKVFRREYVACYSYETIKKNASFDKIGILKIDVEGGELEVITGLLPLIQNDRPYILVEILPAHKNTNLERINRQNQIQQILKDVNYSVFRIYKNKENTLNCIKKLEEIGIHSDIELCDYLMIPNEKEAKTVANFAV